MVLNDHRDLVLPDDLMTIKRLMCRNLKTGAEAEIAELTLQHMSDWVPIGQLAEGSGPEAGEKPAAPPVTGDADLVEPAATAPTRKTKAAIAAKNEKE